MATNWIARLFLLAGLLSATHGGTAGVNLAPAGSRHGYIARLLINEVPFPGERSYRSETDTRAAMESVLNVLDARLLGIPPGYSQVQVAAVSTTNVIDIITAGGVRGQVDGFYRNSSGKFVTVPRVEQRISRLLEIANTGPPGTFARILTHADKLATDYVKSRSAPPDRFANLTTIGDTRVTGRAYSWMTAAGSFHPGGSFIAIPTERSGVLGGNRFFALRAKSK
jgi:hypothetical protein